MTGMTHLTCCASLIRNMSKSFIQIILRKMSKLTKNSPDQQLRTGVNTVHACCTNIRMCVCVFCACDIIETQSSYNYWQYVNQRSGQHNLIESQKSVSQSNTIHKIRLSQIHHYLQLSSWHACMRACMHACIQNEVCAGSKSIVNYSNTSSMKKLYSDHTPDKTLRGIEITIHPHMWSVHKVATQTLGGW